MAGTGSRGVQTDLMQEGPSRGVRKRALLLTTGRDTAEMEELVFALGAELFGVVQQRRPEPDPQLFLGRGKMEEVRDAVRAAGVEVVVVNGALKPGQVFGIQKWLSSEGRSVEVYDRTRLILEIFKERARSPEARLQVELAQLHYDMPLVKEAIHLAKRGERQAAMFGGGEYGAYQLQDMMKKRMARIRRDLDRMRAERGVRRKHRRRGGFHLVSLAGYTNAGKSSLLKAMSERHTLVENRYFSTLSTKTARATSDRREILVTDTVGFIEDLPPWMVEAFHSTLEEIALADVILLVLDASDPVDEMARRLRSSLRILHEFDANGARDADPARPGAPAAGEGRGPGRVPWQASMAPLLVALNKVDRVEPREVLEKAAKLEADGLLAPDQWVALSARTGEGLGRLYARLYGLIPDYDEYEVALPPSPEAEALVAWLHDATDVLDLTRGNETHLHFEAKRSLRTELLSRLARVGATPLREVLRTGPADSGGAGTDAKEGPAPDAEPAQGDAATPREESGTDGDGLPAAGGRS